LVRRAGGLGRQLGRISRDSGDPAGVPRNDESGWSAFLRHLVDRGLNGVQLVIFDACRGLVESVADFCRRRATTLHGAFLYRNVPSTRVREVSHMLPIMCRRAARPPTRSHRQSSKTCGQSRWAKQPTSSSRQSMRH